MEGMVGVCGREGWIGEKDWEESDERWGEGQEGEVLGNGKGDARYDDVGNEELGKTGEKVYQRSMKCARAGVDTS